MSKRVDSTYEFNNLKEGFKDLLKDLEEAEKGISKLFDRIKQGKIDRSLKEQYMNLRTFINVTLISIWSGCRCMIDPNGGPNKVVIQFTRRYVKGSNYSQMAADTARILTNMQILCNEIFGLESDSGHMLRYKTLTDFIKEGGASNFKFIINEIVSPADLFHLNNLRIQFGKKMLKLLLILGFSVVAIVGVGGYLYKVHSWNNNNDNISDIQIPDFDSVPDVSDADFIKIDEALSN